MGETRASLELIGNQTRKLSIKATVLANPPQPLILGMIFLREMKAAICLVQNTVNLAQNLIIPLGASYSRVGFPSGGIFLQSLRGGLAAGDSRRE